MSAYDYASTDEAEKANEKNHAAWVAATKATAKKEADAENHAKK